MAAERTTAGGQRLSRKATRLVLPRSVVLVAAPTLLAAIMLPLVVSDRALPVVLPLDAVVILAALFVFVLWTRDRALPIFELGTVTVLSTALYAIVPLLGFWMGGLQWTRLSYGLLYSRNPGPQEIGAFAWRHVLYLASFVIAYLAVRGRGGAGGTGSVPKVRRSLTISIVLVAAVLVMYFRVLELTTGVSYDPSYSDLTKTVASREALPLFIQQLSQNLYSILFLLKLCLLVVLMARWRDPRWRMVLIFWLTAEGAMTIARMGGRTWFVLLLVAATLLYHRFVRHLSLGVASAAVGVIVVGALMFGFARDLRGNWTAVFRSGTSPWVTMNEFQALFGVSYDLYVRKLAGKMGPVPWQIPANDLLMLIPSQFLPFAKLDSCFGWPVVDGVGVGCVVGVVAYAIVGLDWFELALRGAVLGVLFAALHRWYIRRQTAYWPTVFYLFLCLWSYYTFRASTFFFVYYIAYRFIPLVVLIHMTQLLVQRVHRASMRSAQRDYRPAIVPSAAAWGRHGPGD